MTRDHIPALMTFSLPGDPVALIAWCPFCERYHWHGRGGRSDEELAADHRNHRVAHCSTHVWRPRRGWVPMERNYRSTGYYLDYYGPASPEIVWDATRKQSGDQPPKYHGPGLASFYFVRKKKPAKKEAQVLQ